MGINAVRFVAWLLASFALVAGTAAVSADEFTTASISTQRVDWRAALDQLRSEINAQPAVASDFTFTGRRRLGPYDPRATPALVQLNAVTSQVAPFKTGDTTFSTTDIAGNKTRTIAAWTRRDGRVWFFKATGPTAAIEKEKPNFVKFIESVRF